MTRAPVDAIRAPRFPGGVTWLNSRPLQMHRLRGRPVLVEFWDFCRPNSLRTLPYLTGWHARYAGAGLVVIGVHSPGFAPSADLDATRAAVTRLGIEYPVLVDSGLDVWQDYENLGWPARYLFGADNMLFEYHFGEGAYAETEAAIQTLLGDALPPTPLMDPVRPGDAPEATLAVQSDDISGPIDDRLSCSYEAGEVWAVLSGAGEVRANGTRIPVTHPGAHRLLAHPRSDRGELTLEVGDGVVCHGVCFTPGLAG